MTVTIDTSRNGFAGSGGYGKVRIGKIDQRVGVVAVKAMQLAGEPNEIEEQRQQ